MTEPLLRLTGIAKSFGGVRALVDGQLSLYSGSVTSLIGENGAGKSTLVKILTGVYQPDGGSIRFDGREIRIDSPAAAEQLGISVIHQESVSFDDLSVAENIFITAPPRYCGLIHWRAMRRRSAEILRQLDAPIAPGTRMGDLSVAQKHLVQIARALSCDASIVIMDEPTAALSHRETADLLQIVRRLKSEGRAILYISHKFEETYAIADRYAVFRDGVAVGAGTVDQVSVQQLISLMVGRAVQATTRAHPPTAGNEKLRVQDLCCDEQFSRISFSVHRGEILGVYGLIGAGRSEVMQSIFGMNASSAGGIFIDGQPVSIANPDQAIRHGIAYVPEDRQAQGVIVSLAVDANLTLPSLARFARFGCIDRASERAVAHQWIDRLQIKCSGPGQAVEQLSGGNQQKVVLAKWMLTQPTVLILDEPTKGIDISSKAAVHALMNEWALQGIAIILVSSELPEILSLADRVLVMRRGLARALFTQSQMSAEQIVRAATDA